MWKRQIQVRTISLLQWRVESWEKQFRTSQNRVREHQNISEPSHRTDSELQTQTTLALACALQRLTQRECVWMCSDRSDFSTSYGSAVLHLYWAAVVINNMHYILKSTWYQNWLLAHHLWSVNTCIHWKETCLSWWNIIIVQFSIKLLIFVWKLKTEDASRRSALL